MLLAAAIALGVASIGQDALTPAAGTLVLALYGAALVGVGVAVGGLFRPAFATPVVLAVAIGTFLVDLLAPILRLPDWVGGLALTTHLGDPMVGSCDGWGCSPASRSRSAGSRRSLGDAPAGRRRMMGAGGRMSPSRPGQPWLLLIYRIKAESSGRRTYVWRQLRQLGAVYLQQAAAVLPDRPELRAELDRLGQRIRSAGGEASLLETVSPPRLGGRTGRPVQRARDAEYEEILDSVERFEDEIRRETRKRRFRFAELEEGEADWEKLQRWFARLIERDFFGAPGGRRPRRRSHAGARCSTPSPGRCTAWRGSDLDTAGGRAGS